MHHHATAISPLDGRYAKKLNALTDIVSDYGLTRYRLMVELSWLQFMAGHNELTLAPTLNTEASAYLNNILDNYGPEAYQTIKEIEARINHDVKAVEYYIKSELNKSQNMLPWIECVHFACTSEDINNLAYGLMLKDIHTVLDTALNELIHHMRTKAHDWADIVMLGRTHGQPATPTTVGKEYANFVYRLQQVITQLKHVPIYGKFNGAVGNYNAHAVAYPEIDWPVVSLQFVAKLGLTWHPYTTQIEPHDGLARFANACQLINTILLDFSRDMWSWISVNYFKQLRVNDEVGSSTMPHKINPIYFENAEGNIGLANALLAHFAQKLPISRWQRDLSDSTVMRNQGVAFGYMLLAIKSLQQGLSRIDVNQTAILEDLNRHWEVLAEPIQTVMRRDGMADSYEALKDLTRGEEITAESLVAFIDTLPLDPGVKGALKGLKPENYTGLAAYLAKAI